MSKASDLPGGIKRTGKVTPQTIEAIRSKLEKVIDVLKEKKNPVSSEEIMKLVYSLNPKVPIFNIYHDGLLEVLSDDSTFVKIDNNWTLAEFQQSSHQPTSNGVLSPDEIAKLFVNMAPAEEAAPTVTPNSNAQLSQDDIASLIASMTADETEKPEPIVETTQAKPSGASLSQDDIASLIASMTDDDAKPEPEMPRVETKPSSVSLSQDDIASLIASMTDGQDEKKEPEIPKFEVQSPGISLSQDDISNLFGSVNSDQAQTSEPSEIKVEAKPSGVSLSQDDIAALIGSMTMDENSNGGENKVSHDEAVPSDIEGMVTMPPSMGALLSQDEITNLLDAEAEQSFTEISDPTENIVENENAPEQIDTYEPITEENIISESIPVDEKEEVSGVLEEQSENDKIDNLTDNQVPTYDAPISESVTEQLDDIELQCTNLRIETNESKLSYVEPSCPPDIESQVPQMIEEIGLHQENFMPDQSQDVMEMSIIESINNRNEILSCCEEISSDIPSQIPLKKETFHETSSQRKETIETQSKTSFNNEYSPNTSSQEIRRQSYEITGTATCSLCLARWDGPLQYCPNCGIKLGSNYNGLKLPATVRGSHFEVTVLGIENGIYHSEKDCVSFQFMNVRLKNTSKKPLKLTLESSFSLVNLDGIQIDSLSKDAGIFDSYNDFWLYPDSACFKLIPFPVDNAKLTIDRVYWRYVFKDSQYFEEYTLA